MEIWKVNYSFLSSSSFIPLQSRVATSNKTERFEQFNFNLISLNNYKTHTFLNWNWNTTKTQLLSINNKVNNLFARFLFKKNISFCCYFVFSCFFLLKFSTNKKQQNFYCLSVSDISDSVLQQQQPKLTQLKTLSSLY